LLNGRTAELFETFRQEVKALDPCVSEQFLKLYVAYKAETNFADVIPQAKALLISINIDPHELSDPRQIGTDVTGIGRWGNGNTEVKLTESEDLPYVIGLVRQALDRQLSLEEAI
jgi:predicted transport protein